MEQSAFVFRQNAHCGTFPQSCSLAGRCSSATSQQITFRSGFEVAMQSSTPNWSVEPRGLNLSTTHQQQELRCSLILGVASLVKIVSQSRSGDEGFCSGSPTLGCSIPTCEAWRSA